MPLMAGKSLSFWPSSFQRFPASSTFTLNPWVNKRRDLCWNHFKPFFNSFLSKILWITNLLPLPPQSKFNLSSECDRFMGRCNMLTRYDATSQRLPVMRWQTNLVKLTRCCHVRLACKQRMFEKDFECFTNVNCAIVALPRVAHFCGKNSINIRGLNDCW